MSQLLRFAQSLAPRAVHRDDALTPEERDAFWAGVDEFENAPLTTDFQRLADAGVELPDPAALDEGALPATLQTVIQALADLNVFLNWTDHLSDRELYEKLWHSILREEHEVLSEGWCSFVDVLGEGTDESTQLYLKYFASERDRQTWQAEFPSTQGPGLRLVIPRERH